MLSDQDQEKLRTYLTSIMPIREMVDQYVSENDAGETSCIPELGWVPRGHEKAAMALEIRLRFTHTKRIAVAG